MPWRTWCHLSPGWTCCTQTGPRHLRAWPPPEWLRRLEGRTACQSSLEVHTNIHTGPVKVFQYSRCVLNSGALSYYCVIVLARCLRLGLEGVRNKPKWTEMQCIAAPDAGGSQRAVHGCSNICLIAPKHNSSQRSKNPQPGLFPPAESVQFRGLMFD